MRASVLSRSPPLVRLAPLNSRLLGALAAFLFAPAAFAQTGALIGRVVDAENGLALPTASVVLWRTTGADSAFVGGASAGMDGAFRVASLAAGTYAVTVRFVGYDDVRRHVQVGAAEIDLGTVGLAPSAAALGEATVTAEASQVQTQIDRTVYNTADDPVAEGGSATDVLAALPSVSVDIDGNVSLRGAGNVAVFINGRPAPVSGTFLASYLQSLPAGSVERVEIIPNPSAAFDPDGVGGVINIVLKKNTDPGLGGTLTAGTDTRGGYNGTGAVTYGRGPWSLAATLGHRRDDRGGAGTSFRINRYETSPTTLDQSEASSRTRTSNLLNLSADYSLTAKTTLTSQLQLGTRAGDEDELQQTLQSSAAGAPLFSYDRRVTQLEDGRQGDARLGVRHTFAEDHTLVVEGRADASTETENQAFLNTVRDGAGDIGAPQTVTQDNGDSELALQVDYTRPLAGFRLDAGYKGIRERERTTLDAATLDAATGAYVPDVDLNNRFDYDQTVQALYAQAAREWGPVGVQAGLRYERAATTFRLRTTAEAFPNDYASLFPSAYLSFKPAESTAFKVGYSRRINRPDAEDLNPFQSFDDPLNIRQGNPALRPEYVDAVEFGVTRYTAWGSLAVTPYARHTTDVIRRVSTVRADGVTVRTFTNLDTADSYGGEAVASLEGVAGIRGYASLEGFRLQTSGTSTDATLSNDAFGWGGRVNATVSLGDRVGIGALDLQATARYSAPLRTEQGRVGARTFIDLALRQKLLGDRASLTLQARDPFGLAGFSYTLDQPELYQTLERTWGAQQLGLTFAYTFGRQSRRDDDGEGGGGSGGGDVSY